jgi:hypothetical protein
VFYPIPWLSGFGKKKENCLLMKKEKMRCTYNVLGYPGYKWIFKTSLAVKQVAPLNQIGCEKNTHTLYRLIHIRHIEGWN